MQRIQTEVLVIGGGATGTGILRDLAMRGFKTLLVEKSDLATGTTGRYHGLLHSGGRYVVTDPQAARECIQENRLLRRIMPHCLEDIGGLFVLTPWDDPGYCEPFLLGCQQAGIPVEEVPLGKVLAEQPLLNPAIQRCFHVPDAAADSFLAAQCNVASAREYGADCLTYQRVTGLLVEGGRVCGARLFDLAGGQELEVRADLTVNAAGAWVGQVCAMAGVEVHILPGKGTMLALSQRILHTVVNRCKLPSDGDILVPIHSVTVMGTTDVRVSDPDHFSIEPWEVQLMLTEGEKLVPGFRSLRLLRAWAGVRPLYQENDTTETRQVSRAFVLLDHQQRDGLAGLVSITSGKWTTYRRMAEAASDLVCQHLGVSRPCRTHLEALPDTRLRPSMHAVRPGTSATAALGERLADIEARQAFGELLCECELVTLAQVSRAVQAGARSIDDLRRQVRLGMGPCQGGFCTFRAAGLLHQLGSTDAAGSNNALRDFLSERWKGLVPVLWGVQLRQERLDELIYLSLLNADHLPGRAVTPYSPIPYVPPSDLSVPAQLPSLHPPEMPHPAGSSRSGPAATEILVIGAGLAGLCAAWQAARNGRKVRLVAQGHGSLYFHAGCIDVLGYQADSDGQALPSPAEGLRRLVQENPSHPYSLAGMDAIPRALKDFQQLCRQAEYPMSGSLERNWMLPTSAGSLRPTCLAPDSMLAGEAGRSDPLWVVGLAGYRDFYPSWVAANLETTGLRAHALMLDLPPLHGRRLISSRLLADLLDAGQLQEAMITAMRKALAGPFPFPPSRLGFPAILGLLYPTRVRTEVEQALGLPVFEIPTLPPSIPGMRLAAILEKEIRSLGGSIHTGLEVFTAEVSSDDRLVRVWCRAAARSLPLSAESFILATGGILGGGFQSGSRGEFYERILRLPLDHPEQPAHWFQPNFFAPGGHPIFRVGINVDRNFQPVDRSGRVLHPNLYAAGSALAGTDPLVERSLDGLALVSGCLAGKHA